MELERDVTCCFTGHRPDKLPWGEDEADPRCILLKQSMAREIEGLYRRGWRHFVSGMARGADLYFAEAVLSLRERCRELSLEAAVPCLSQADRWPPAERERRQALLDAADLETVVQREYDRGCMHRRDRYMVSRSSAVLAVYDGSPGGTRYTLECARREGLEILLLDLNDPAAEAVRLKK